MTTMGPASASREADAGLHSPSVSTLDPTQPLRIPAICAGDTAWRPRRREFGIRSSRLVNNRSKEHVHDSTHVREEESGVHPVKQDTSGIAMKCILRKAL